MTLQECYDALGGSYEEVMGRLRMERLVSKFTLKFLEDGSYRLLTGSLEEADYETAFRAAHTLKGVCQNLAFTRLYQSSHDICEALRGGRPLEDPALLEKVTEDYDATVEAIKAYQAANPA